MFGRIQSRVMEGFIRARYERQDLIDELDRQKTAAENANRAKSRFFAAASHDLRQPLHALGLFAASLRDVTAEHERRRIVDQVHASIGALDSLFEELLDISKIDAGVATPRPTHFAIATVLESMRVQFTVAAAAKGLSLRVAPSRAVVHTDAVLLERVVANLVSSAIRDTAAGKVLIGCRRRGDRLWLEVWDTGAGIPATEQERVFEEFYQLDNPGRDRGKGLGLGLATVKRLVTLLEYPLRLRSVPDVGTMFRRELPIGEARGIGSTALAAAEFVDVLVGKRIVVVVDEQSIRNGMQQLLLARWGCLPVVAAMTAEAPQLLRASGAPDLIICDHRLAGEDTGTQAIDAMRARYGAPIPAILLTGEIAPERGQERLAGGHLLQRKPLRPAQLRATCNHLLTSERA